jgi:hypothetical protein
MVVVVVHLLRHLASISFKLLQLITDWITNMALKKVFYTASDTFDAYWRVEETRIVNKNKMMVCVRAYRKPTDSYHIDERCFDTVTYVMNEKNAWVQAYEYIKQLPEFAGAVDA